MNGLAIISELPEGPMGFVLFMGAVIVAGLVVMAVSPIMNAVDRWRFSREAKQSKNRGE